MQKIVMSDTETLETDEKQYFTCKQHFFEEGTAWCANINLQSNLMI